MTDTILLQRKIEKSGLKIGFIAQQLDTSYGWLNKKINNDVAFKAHEIQTLCALLNIVDLAEKEAIFFAQNVEKSST